MARKGDCSAGPQKKLRAGRRCSPLTRSYLLASSLKKKELLADIDQMDISVRQETLTNVQGQPVLVQLPLIPCYAS